MQFAKLISQVMLNKLMFSVFGFCKYHSRVHSTQLPFVDPTFPVRTLSGRADDARTIDGRLETARFQFPSGIVLQHDTGTSGSYRLKRLYVATADAIRMVDLLTGQLVFSVGAEAARVANSIRAYV
jgi:hypothetical protein